MPTYKEINSVTIAGEAMASSLTITAEGSIVKSVTVAAAKVGQLTTRTDNDTGELTMSSGHGITTGALLDIYWDGGARRLVTVGTVATNAVPIDGGSGDNLPTNLTAITAMVPQEEEFLVTGNNVSALALYSTARGQVTLTESDDSEVTTYEIPDSTSKGYFWNNVTGGTSPVASADVAKAYFSQASSSSTCTATAAVLFS